MVSSRFITSKADFDRAGPVRTPLTHCFYCKQHDESEQRVRIIEQPDMTKQCLQRHSMGPLMDVDLTRCLGSKRCPGRHAGSEVTLPLASCKLQHTPIQAVPTAELPPRECTFEMTQRHAKLFTGNDGSPFLCFFVLTKIKSSEGHLSSARVDFHLGAQGCPFLSADPPLDGAEFAAPTKKADSVMFLESTPHEGMYIGYESCGSMTCGLNGSQKAFMSIQADESSSQDGSSLSGVLLLCLPASCLRFPMTITVAASLAHGGSSKELEYVLRDQKVKLSVTLRRGTGA